jgi:hypothetical protein
VDQNSGLPTFDFSFWKIKLVLAAGPLMASKIFFFVVPEIFKRGETGGKKQRGRDRGEETERKRQRRRDRGEETEGN